MALTKASRKRTLWGTALIALVGLIHLLVVPEYFEFATYLGLLFILNALGALASAVGIYRRAWWGWPLGVVIAGGAFFMYIESRTVGLPMLNEGWIDPPGVLSLIIEAIFVVIYQLGVRRRAPEGKTSY
ncbi:MAG TPA: hypothetical protein VE288_12715 [Rubrobacteraceae bacterium]|jgi:hypothetical protein|nr:hypothetical protein [Rubrobacteraceae bacterium]